ncbi:MAG: hypothetical protein GX491_16235 [Chloroflexi bacterium]|nr:hypothetical protein [Chloroflexota bacterium]
MDSIEISCPVCEVEIRFAPDARWVKCDHCGVSLDAQSQLAFLRGEDAFSDGQEIYNEISPRARRNPDNPKDIEAIMLFREAYSSLQLAFEGELVESQRRLGVEMMASMAQEFMMRMMASDLESHYWQMVLTEQNSRIEYDEIKEKLKQSRSIFGIFGRLRLRLRQFQLRRSLRQLDKKISQIERHIAFVKVPNARDKNWEF